MAQAERANDGGVEEPDDDKPVKPEPAAVRENEEDGSVTVSDDNARPTRKERRGGRQADEVARWRDQAQNLERQLQQTREEMQREIQRVHQRIAQPAAGADPYESRIDSIHSEQESIQATMRAGNVDAATAERMRQRFYDLNREERTIERKRMREEVLNEVRPALQQRQNDGQGEEAIMRAEFPEVIANQKALRYALGEYHRLTAEDEPATLATTRKAMMAAVKRFNLRPETAPAVAPAVQQRFGAVSAQAGAGGNAGETRLDTNQKKMAIARWPNIDEHDAYRRMAALLRNASRDEQAPQD
jgi:hypothetical protein